MEALLSVAIGYVIALISQYLVFPLFGIHNSLSTNAQIAGVFTIISVIRAYVMRRLFNAWHVKKYVQKTI